MGHGANLCFANSSYNVACLASLAQIPAMPIVLPSYMTTKSSHKYLNLYQLYCEALIKLVCKKLPVTTAETEKFTLPYLHRGSIPQGKTFNINPTAGAFALTSKLTLSLN